MSSLQPRYMRRRINGISRKLTVIILFLSLIAIVTWRINEKIVDSSTIKVPWFGAESTRHKNKRSKMVKKYLSYQPPGGGWNNQRIAFENAVMIASMLGRTLLVQPLAPHDRMLELITRSNRSVGYAIYNMLTENELVPLSKLINLNRLSSLPLSVQVVSSNHEDFVKKYSNYSWYKVCRNGLAHAWIDKIPVGFNTSSLNLEKYSENFQKQKRTPKIAKYRAVCPNKTKNHLDFWEFLPELRKRSEDIIYFEKGSLFVRHLFFTDYQRALKAQKTVIDYIQPAQDVLGNAARIIHSIGKPFSAIHVRRNNHETGKSLNIQHWLSKLTEANALEYSNRLYIATDETNLTWFDPLTEAGYNILFAKNFRLFREIHEGSPITGKDVIGFHEQVLCSRAKIFIGSYYSTFSRFIERYREAQIWNRKHFRRFRLSSVIWLNIYRQ